MVEVAVVGLGPAGRALASRLAHHGASVVAIDPRPEAVWAPTYGVWADELDHAPLDSPAEVVRSLITAPEIRSRGRHLLERSYAVLDNAALQRALPLDGVEVRKARLDEAQVAGLLSEIAVVVDARGARPSGTGDTTADPHSPAPHEPTPQDPAPADPTPADPAPAQTAFGIVVPADAAAPALDGAEALLMDWRTDWADHQHPVETPATFLYAIPLGDGTVLLEETCLAAAPGLPIDELKQRLHRRLRARGVAQSAINAPLHREIVRIPMRGRGRPAPPGVLAVGTAGRGGNVVTGYSVAHSLISADRLAQRLVAGDLPRRADPLAPADLLREAGLRALLRLDVDGTLDLFDAFGRLPHQRQRAFWSRESDAPAMAGAMWGMFARMPGRSRIELARATLGPSSHH